MAQPVKQKFYSMSQPMPNNCFTNVATMFIQNQLLLRRVISSGSGLEPWSCSRAEFIVTHATVRIIGQQWPLIVYEG